MKNKKNILLNPGPCNTSKRVKNAQIVPDICPREEKFTKVIKKVRRDLLKVLNTDKNMYSTILFGGSGTAAVESVISSVIIKNEKLLVLVNGSYGERIFKIAKTHMKLVDKISFKLTKPINFQDVEKYLQLNKDISYIAMVHHETTTGILNSIDKFSKISQKYNLTSIIDSISSFAGIPIDFKKTPIDYLISTSNKCIQGMAGIAFVICKESKIKILNNKSNFSYYLNLYNQYEYLERKGEMQFTPPVQTIYALKEAIQEYLEEGIKQRYDRYTLNWETLRKGLKKLGFKFLLNKKDESHILLSVLKPNNKNFSYNILHDLLFEQGITIYPGKLAIKNTFRIANMGIIDKNDIIAFISSLKVVLKKMKIKKIYYDRFLQ
tara:strand:- start:1874 stop:3010 length:1137 start_codon:yes stop_codon:yes gene_type:complete